MLKTYPAIFHKDGSEGYWIEFPDFAGGTEAENLEEAMKNAREMLEGVLASYLDQGMDLPITTDIEDITVEDGFVTLIQADPTSFLKNNKAIRKNVTVPEWLVRFADREQINYSEVLSKALEKKLQL